jgi:aspartyl-tRNA(Asn)/glutamyl-tRNA(Gln) amidotransferase subunit C
METKTSTAHVDVAYVARLARMHLAPEETARLQAQLDQIVGYVAQIDALDVTGVEPTSHAVAINNVFRPDEAREGLAHEAVLANAPDEIAGQFRVPKIVE